MTATKMAARHIGAAEVRRGRMTRLRRRMFVTWLLAFTVLAVFAVMLLVGNTFYTPGEVARVILGESVPGASFTVGELRLPRATLGVLSGFAFGAAGTTFQTLLRNPLASPDIIGISAGAAAAAVIGIVVLSLDGPLVSLLALGAALATALTIYLLSHRGVFSGARFVLIGIGLAAMLHSLTSYVLSRAASWDMQAAMQWITGSLNGASWANIMPLLLICVALVPLLVGSGRSLELLQLGDDAATALGLPVRAARVLLIIAAVTLLAFATAASGPIAFVAFMAGPIAARLVGNGGAMPLQAGLVGALLVMCSDLVGQFMFEGRYPVGVITGVLGAPYLILLLIRMNRTGSAL